MSRGNNTDLVNPCTRWIEWKGDEGKLQYYDKELKGNVEVPLPFRFLVLDRLSVIKGYSDADQSGFWSNEVRDLSSEPFIVRTKKGKFPPMLYEQVKEKLSNEGIQYCQSVYIGYFDENKKLVLGNIQIKGCALGPWIDFCKANKIMEIGVQIKGKTEGKKGKTVFQSPVFEALKITEETNKSALALDEELQNYLTLYFKNTKKEAVEIKNEAVEIKENETKQEVSEMEKRNIKTAMSASKPEPDDLPFL